MAFDSAEWKRKVAEVLREHPDIGRATGMLEINMGEGGITKAYLNKRIKNAAELTGLDHLKDKVESVSVRIIIG
jgi:ubiquinone/menaquinone biosynthesis C-methylase UbiE